VLALALGLFAATPFLLRPGLPRQTDAELHVYRAAELGHVIRHGVFYPRWAPNLYLGYGYPIFNYYAPFTYYLSNAFALVLPGLEIVSGVKAVFVLGLVLAAIGAYLLGRVLFDPGAGILAAAAFTFSPYILFIDPHARGDLAEHFAFCLIPLTFYFLHELLWSPNRRMLLGTVLCLATIVFSHNLAGLVTSVLMLAYWAWAVLVGGRRRHALWGPVAFALAAAIIAFFWVPALLESDAVQLQVIGPGHFDFREHFLSLAELVAPSRLIDWGAAGPRFRHNLGLAQWLLALPAPLVAVRSLKGRGEKRRNHVLFFLLGALVLIFLTVPVSQAIWESVPLMPYLQFPWRLLGPANFMLAICAASSVSLVSDNVWRRLVMGGSLTFILLTSLPSLYPPPWSADFGGTAPADIIRWERDSQALGTTSTGDFLPVDVKMIPPPMESLVSSYLSDGPVDKVNRATVPEGGEVTVLEHGPIHDRIRVSTAEGFVLRLYTFYFPGWKAYVNGEPVEIEIAGPEGFITIPLPPGEHDVMVRFESTLPRKLGAILSATGLIGLLAICLTWKPQPGRRTSVVERRSDETRYLAGALVFVMLLKAAVVDPLGCLHYRSPPGRALPAQEQIYADFGEEIALIGYDLPRTRVQTGDTVSIVLYWHALTDIEKNYQSFVHIAEPLTVAWAQEDHLNPGGLPTSRWRNDKYVWDEYNIRIPPNTPAGEYRVNVGLYQRSDGSRLVRRDGASNEADSIVISSIEVVAAEP